MAVSLSGRAAGAVAGADVCKGVYPDTLDSILVKRDVGGAGDILAHRPLFKDLRAQLHRKVVFAVPAVYIPLVQDHPYIDRVVDSATVRKCDYAKVFSTLGKAAVYEFSKVPFVDKHRTELWAGYLGITLTSFDGHVRFTDWELDFSERFLSPFSGLKVGFMPVSSHPCKDVRREVIQEVIDQVSLRGASCFVFHNKPLGFERSTDVNVGIRKWMALTSRMDVVVTVATSMFHLANLLHIPTVAIFGVEDLAVFGKFFPEMVPIQRTRKDPKWPFCPCWSGLDCKMRVPGERDIYPPACLRSITADEICEGVGKASNGRLQL